MLRSFARLALTAAVVLAIGGRATAQSGGDGSSIEQAIVITASSETQGIAAEREWVARNLPGWKMAGQALLHRPNGRSYDRLNLTGPNRAKKSIYFDITAFFGKP
jgi:hypothetical protein